MGPYRTTETPARVERVCATCRHFQDFWSTAGFGVRRCRGRLWPIWFRVRYYFAGDDEHTDPPGGKAHKAWLSFPSERCWFWKARS